jgi:hypothetical protein
MTHLSDVCRHIRSKNAGPFWITVDLFFVDREAFDRWSAAPALRADALAKRFAVDAALLRIQLAPDLAALKFSYPRREAQGGRVERDMHGGQQFVKILDLDLTGE